MHTYIKVHMYVCVYANILKTPIKGNYYTHIYGI